MMLEIISQSPAQTQKIAKLLAEEILKSSWPNKKALIIGLQGDLGSGKTTFVQGLAKGLGIKEKITSPTFVILKKFQIKNYNFYHIDCYRINSPEEIKDLGLQEIINQSKNIVVIEWAERIKKILPKNTLWIKFEYL